MKQGVYDILVDLVLTGQAGFYRLAYSYLNNREDALDAVQNAVSRALGHYGELKSEKAVKSWFYRILINECLMLLKERARSAGNVDDMGEVPYEEKGFEPSADLGNYLDCLDTETKTIIKLRFFEELSLTETAEIMDMNLNTVKAKLYRGLKQLKAIIPEDEL